MRKRTIAGLAGIATLVVLSGGVTGIGALSASAHTPAASITCDAGSVSLTSYDRHATADVTLDGVTVHAGEFGGRLVASYPTTSGPDTHTLTVHVVSKDSPRYNFDQTVTAEGCAPVTPPPATEPPTPEPTTPPVTETPEPEPTTPPVETPAPVIVPQVQDYVTCKGGAFVLDNTGSTVDVTFTVNDLPYLVPAGQAVHTDADGTILQPNSDFEGFTIKAGERTWNFPSGGNCGTDPTTGCPTVGDPTEPCDGGTPPVVTPPTDEPTTPAPTDEPTTPAPTDEPSTEPTTPTDETTPPASSTPVPSDVPTPVSTSPTSSEPTPVATTTAAPAAADTTRTGSLAYTGSEGLVAGGILALGLIALGAFVLVHRTRARRAGR